MLLVEPAAYQLETPETLKSIAGSRGAGFITLRHHGNRLCGYHVLGVLVTQLVASAHGDSGEKPAAFQALPLILKPLFRAESVD